MLINDDKEFTANGDPNEEECQGLPDYLDIYYIIDNSDEEMAFNYYDQYIRGEVVIPDSKGEKLIVKIGKHIKYDVINTGEGHYNSMHYNYVYELYYPD